MYRKYVLYPVLFSIYPVLAIAAYNIDQITIDVILRPLLVVSAASLLLLGLGWLILRDWHRAGLIVSLFLLFFFLYGHVYNLLEDVTLANISIFRHRTLVPFFGIVLIVLLYWLVRRVRKPASFT